MRTVAITVVFILLLSRKETFSQNTNQIQNRELEQKLENVALETDAPVDISNIIDEQWIKHGKKLNLNIAGERDLVESGLFSALQAEAIVKHRFETGPLQSVYELQSFGNFSREQISAIKPIITFSEDTLQRLQTIFYESDHRVIARSARFFPNAKGFTNQTGSKYVGDPYDLYLRYRAALGRNLQLGFLADKDRGEMLFGKYSPYGFDSYAGFIQLEKYKSIEKLIIGNYQLSYGQGLLMWNGFGYGKTPDALNVVRFGGGIMPSLNSYKSQRFQGLAGSFTTKNLKLDFFGAYDKLDANLSEDSVDQNTVASSIQDADYHRTLTEIENRNKINRSLVGAHIGYNRNNLELGATYFHTHFDHLIRPTARPYNFYYFKGQDLNGVSADLKYNLKNGIVFGEFASNPKFGYAYNAGMLLSLDKNLSYTFLYRNFSQAYVSMFSNAFSENSKASNESGAYNGVEWLISNKWKVSAYADVFKVPWISFLSHASYSGKDYFLQNVFNISKEVEIAINYRIKDESKNQTSDFSSLIRKEEMYQKQNLRFNILYKINRLISLRTRAEWTKISAAGIADQQGVLLFQDFSWQPFGKPYAFVFRYAVFDTDSYDTRIYAYENNVQYYFYFPAYYGKGSKVYLTAKWKLTQNLHANIHLAKTWYNDVTTVGSGLDQINGSAKTELRFQLLYEIKNAKGKL